MSKLDPKLLKKVSQSELIAAAKIMNIKNAEKVSKENLIPAFLNAVQAVSDAEVEGLDKVVINMNNFLMETFDLADEPESTDKEGGEKTMAKETKKAEKKTPKAKAPAKPGWGELSFGVIQNLKKSATKEEVSKLIAEARVKSGGKVNKDAPVWWANMAVEAGLAFNKITIDGDKISPVK
jgi:hypothetical protein